MASIRTSHKSKSWFILHLLFLPVYLSYRAHPPPPTGALVWGFEVHDGSVGGWIALPAISWLFICRCVCVCTAIYECPLWLLMLFPYTDEIMEMPEWIVFPKLIVIESLWCQVQIWGQANCSQVVHRSCDYIMIPARCLVESKKLIKVSREKMDCVAPKHQPSTL